MTPTPRAPLLTACRRPGSRPTGRFGAWLALLVVAWLLTQALGQAHAVLHGRPSFAVQAAGAGKAAPAPVTLLSRAFHLQKETSDPQADGLCRLYGHVVQSGLAAGAPPDFVGPATFDPPAVTTVASAETAPRHAPTARGPPAAG